MIIRDLLGPRIIDCVEIAPGYYVAVSDPDAKCALCGSLPSHKIHHPGYVGPRPHPFMRRSSV